MSKHQTIRAIMNETDRLNRDIDLKIIKGLSYIRESRRHKELMSQLERVSPRRFRWSKLFGFVGTFMF